jgi:ATP-binding cassette subfamily F protein 2
MDNVCTNIMELTSKKKVRGFASALLSLLTLAVFQMVYYTGNYTTYVRTKQENDVNTMKAYQKQQDEIAHIKKCVAPC